MRAPENIELETRRVNVEDLRNEMRSKQSGSNGTELFISWRVAFTQPRQTQCNVEYLPPKVRTKFGATKGFASDSLASDKLRKQTWINGHESTCHKMMSVAKY